jgi:hypothetical protein
VGQGAKFTVVLPLGKHALPQVQKDAVAVTAE